MSEAKKPDVNAPQAGGDAVNHPTHYVRGGMEVIDVIEAFQLGFHEGNSVKYILRAGHKNDLIEDYEKARWYLDRLIGLLKKGKLCPTCRGNGNLVGEVCARCQGTGVVRLIDDRCPAYAKGVADGR